MLSFYTGEGMSWRVAGVEDEERWTPEAQGAHLFEKLLTSRGISPLEEASFLSPSLSDLHDPFLLEGVAAAAERLHTAIREGQHVLVYGDYDVDGVTAVSILKNFFQEIGVPISYYIPDRADEGYGISDVAAQRIIASNVDVLLTVDCGITAKRQVEAITNGRIARGKPLDIIITDHHQSDPENLPQAFALVNPHLPESAYPFKSLCGAGVAWKLVQALCQLMGKPDLALRWLDLAAFATIADIVELTGENRVLVTLGLARMNTSPNPGLSALHAVSGGKSESIDATRVGFMMAPRVNAAGRMGDAKRAVKLLTSKTVEAAQPLAMELDEVNRTRQQTQEEVLIQALALVAARAAHANEPVTMVWGEGWHHGVIGIVASKLVDRFHKPALVLAITEQEAVGSGRSIEGFDLFDALASQSALLTRFGGHAQAGGVSLPKELLESFRDGLNRYARPRITQQMLIPALHAEAELDVSLLTVDMAQRLKQFEPTGQGNRPPLFVVRGLSLSEIRTLSDGKHLRIKAEKHGTILSGVGFGFGEYAAHLEVGDLVDVAGYLERNEWQGRVSVQLRIARMRLSAPARRRNLFMLEAARRLESLDCDAEWLYNGIVLSGQPREVFFPTREDLAAVYRYFRPFPEKICTPGELFLLARKLEGPKGGSLGFFRMMAGLMVFDELGLLSLTLLPDGTYRLGQPPEVDKVELEASELLAFLQEVADMATG